MNDARSNHTLTLPFVPPLNRSRMWEGPDQEVDEGEEEEEAPSGNDSTSSRYASR